MPRYNSTNPKPLPSADYLRACFDYAPETGELRWKVRPREHFATTRAWLRCNTMFAGTIVRADNSGNHSMIGLANSVYGAHRIAWKWMTGQEPPASLDHEDRNGFNNRWSNLRAATPTGQVQNRQQPRTKSSYRGAYQSPGEKRWFSSIRKNRVSHYLGSFNTAEEAAAAYEAAARKFHGEFYCPP
jgi:hypothetical protein